jgi:hypothetical protein
MTIYIWFMGDYRTPTGFTCSMVADGYLGIDPENVRVADIIRALMLAGF